MKKTYLDIRCGKKDKSGGYILDISNVGIGLASSAKIAKNTVVEIFTKQKLPPFLKGRVVSAVARHKKQYGYRLGIKFLFPTKLAARKIAKFVSDIEKRKKSRLDLG